MPREINSALSEAVRELGRSVSPEQLVRRGIERVRWVGTAEISILIERAVNRTLMERTIGPLQADEMRQVMADVQREFASELKGLQDLADSRELVTRHREEMQKELGKLREEIAGRREFLEQGESDPAEAEAARKDRLERLRLRIQARLLPLYDRLPAGAPPLRSVARDLVGVFAAELDQALHEADAARSLEVQNLERRIAKLVASLEETERVLARVAAMKDLEFGLASIYRTVQGLSPEDAHRELKLAMMANLFKANLELQQELLHAQPT